MTTAVDTLKKGWLEKTDYQPVNIAIGTTKFLAGGALTLLAMKKLPKTGLVGGTVISLLQSEDVFYGRYLLRNFERDIDRNNSSGKARIRSFARAVQIVTMGSLLKTALTTLYLRNTSLPMGAAKVFGGLGGGALIGIIPFMEMRRLRDSMGDSDKIYTPPSIPAVWLGIWHPVDDCSFSDAE